MTFISPCYDFYQSVEEPQFLGKQLFLIDCQCIILEIPAADKYGRGRFPKGQLRGRE